MRTVYKFPIPFAGQTTPALSAPRDGKVVLTAVDPRSGQPAVWIDLDTDQVSSENPKPRNIRAFGTGGEVPAGWVHLGSMVDGSFVWHVFEEPRS